MAEIHTEPTLTSHDNITIELSFLFIFFLCKVTDSYKRQDEPPAQDA